MVYIVSWIFFFRFLNDFIVYIHIFNPSGIHFLYGLRFRSNFIFTLIDDQLCQHHLLTNQTFSHWLEPTLSSYIKFLFILESISGLPIPSYWLFYLLLYQSHIDLIPVVLYYVMVTHNLSSPLLIFIFIVLKAILRHFLSIQMLRSFYPYFKKKKKPCWNLIEIAWHLYINLGRTEIFICWELQPKIQHVFIVFQVLFYVLQ